MEIRDLDPGEPAVQVLLQLAHEDQANLSAPPTNNQDLGKDDLGCVGRALRGEVRPSLQEAPASKGTTFWLSKQRRVRASTVGPRFRPKRTWVECRYRRLVDRRVVW